ncbi:MAG: type IV pilus assembly protein PilM [Nitrospinota bacterium]
MADGKDLLVGLDIGDHAIKLIQLRWENDGFSLEKLGTVALEDGVMRAGGIADESALVQAIRGLLEKEEVTQRKVAVALAGNNVALRTVWVPKTDRKEMEALIAWEGEQYLPFPVEESTLDYNIQGETEEDGETWSQVLLAAARRSFVDQYREVLEQAGLQPVVMDCAPLALENGFESSGILEEEEGLALLDIGSQVTCVHLLGGGLSLFTRFVDLGGDDYTRAVAEGLDVDFAKAEEIKCGRDPDHPVDSLSGVLDPVTDRLASITRRIFSTYDAEWPDLPIRGVVLSGGGGQLLGLESQLAKVLGLPVEVANPFARVSFSDEDFDPDFVAAMAPLSAVAMGLGIRSIDD